MGLGMMTPGDSIPALYPDGLCGLPLKEAARAAMSWNLTEASFGLAACNAFYNTPERMAALDCALPGNVYPTAGLDLHDKTVGIVGHMNGPRGLRDIARAVYVLERRPRPGDYPDAACDWLLPRCDVVIITGSSLINKTLPHLLDLCENAVTILTGPSVPMCPKLLDCGIDRLGGFVVTGREAMDAQVRHNVHGSPYVCGESFLLKKR
jgi:uncharacterized protein (DUF4213/DUF364 family)